MSALNLTIHTVKVKFFCSNGDKKIIEVPLKFSKDEEFAISQFEHDYPELTWISFEFLN